MVAPFSKKTETAKNHPNHTCFKPLQEKPASSKKIMFTAYLLLDD